MHHTAAAIDRVSGVQVMRNSFVAMTAIAAVGLGAVTPVHAQRVVVFGDSLSDTGNATALSGGLVPGSPAGRFSNGLNWIDILYGPTTAYFNPANGFNGVTGNPNRNRFFDRRQGKIRTHRHGNDVGRGQ
jgi:phospholipase/lecithinase/hemolysin